MFVGWLKDFIFSNFYDFRLLAIGRFLKLILTDDSAVYDRLGDRFYLWVTKFYLNISRFSEKVALILPSVLD
jgi:hypothetical protein